MAKRRREARVATSRSAPNTPSVLTARRAPCQAGARLTKPAGATVAYATRRGQNPAREVATLPPHRHRHHSHRLHPHHDGELETFLDRSLLERILEPWIPDAKDRAFVTRCIVDEGPAHHRGANYVLLALLARAVEAGGPVGERKDGDAARIPLRLPPHLKSAEDDGAFPLSIPLAPLRALAGGDPKKVAAMTDFLGDGPPQHALANAAMVCLLSVLLERAGLTGR